MINLYTPRLPERTAHQLKASKAPPPLPPLPKIDDNLPLKERLADQFAAKKTKPPARERGLHSALGGGKDCSVWRRRKLRMTSRAEKKRPPTEAAYLNACWITVSVA
jgi:hypothetical protein